jgi:hypothetical protein
MKNMNSDNLAERTNHDLDQDFRCTTVREVREWLEKKQAHTTKNNNRNVIIMIALVLCCNCN